MIRTKLSNQGFTFIEILVVVSLIVLLSGIGVAAYNRFNQTQQLKQTALDFVSKLRAVQTSAVTGEKNCVACRGPDLVCNTSDDLTLFGWQIRFTTSSTPHTYNSRGRCGSTGSNYFSLNTYTLPRNVRFTAGTTDFWFYPIMGNTDITGSQVITLRNVSLGNCINITVYENGDINIGSVYAC